MADPYMLKSFDRNGDGAMVSRHTLSRNSENGKHQVARDDQEMAFLGKKQQLRRNFGFMSMLGFSCTLMITWEGMLAVFVYGLTDGGPAGLIYGYLFCWIGYFCVVASLAEMTSMAPTAGGQYHWTYILAPKKYRNFFSFITGWQSVLAWQALLASGSYLGGTVIQGLLILNYPTYNPQRWQGTLLLYAVLFFALFFNTYLGRHLPKVEALVLIIHIVGFFAILITLTYFAPHGNAHDVFALFLSNGGYDNGTAFFVGLITTTFAFIGTDGAVHMCEEIRNASTIVPYALIASIGINGTLGFAMLIAILFCIGDIDNALSTPTLYPFMEIFYQAVQSLGGATAMSTLVLLMMILATLAVLAAASRMMWAFARDNGLPGSSYLARVEPRSQLPLFAIGTSVVITLLLGLINIGSTAGFNAVASLVIAGYLGSYILPIALLLNNRIRRPSEVAYGPFRLGRLGIPCNIFALVWIAITMTFSFFPAIIPVTLVTMNWSCLIWGGTMIIGIVYYFGYQRGRYNGPIVETEYDHFAPRI